MKDKKNLNYLYYLISIFALGFDILTKILTDGIVFKEGIKGIFAIESHHNTGASFSMFSGSKVAQIIFVILGICVCVLLVLYGILNKTHNKNWCFFVGASLMIGGILGNAIDRIFLGYVRDFISLEFMDFAIFNVADSALCVGAIFMVIWLIFFAFKEKKEKQ